MTCWLILGKKHEISEASGTPVVSYCFQECHDRIQQLTTTQRLQKEEMQ